MSREGEGVGWMARILVPGFSDFVVNIFLAYVIILYHNIILLYEYHSLFV